MAKIDDALEVFKEHTALLYFFVLLFEAFIMVIERLVHLGDDNISMAFLFIALLVVTVYGIVMTRHET